MLKLLSRGPQISSISVRLFATKIDGAAAPDESNKKKILPKNVIEENQTAQHQIENGVIFDKKPFKIRLEKGKIGMIAIQTTRKALPRPFIYVTGKQYSWCLCGKSKCQPICDGTHKNVFMKIKLRPIRFVVEETKDYWLCNCKQTKHRPFCDGTHKQPEIQASKT